MKTRITVSVPMANQCSNLRSAIEVYSDLTQRTWDNFRGGAQLFVGSVRGNERVGHSVILRDTHSMEVKRGVVVGVEMESVTVEISDGAEQG